VSDEVDHCYWLPPEAPITYTRRAYKVTCDNPGSQPGKKHYQYLHTKHIYKARPHKATCIGTVRCPRLFASSQALHVSLLLSPPPPFSHPTPHMYHLPILTLFPSSFPPLPCESNGAVMQSAAALAAGSLAFAKRDSAYAATLLTHARSAPHFSALPFTFIQSI
jgi:hypothetical protein